MQCMILDLQCDLHANNFALREECTFGIPTLLFALPFLLEGVTLHSMLWVSPRQLLTLQLSVYVLAVKARFLATRGIAGSIGISIFFLSF